MLTNIESFLFKQFPNQPLWVRVLAYLVLLGVFVYLTLIPRFIDGQLVVKDQSTGGLIPYRGANIQMQVEGRDYKFQSNEGGYWSIPIVSKLPAPIEFQVFHEDKGQWFKVRFTAVEAWRSGPRQVEISNSSPYISVATSLTPDTKSAMIDMFNRLPIPGVSDAFAGTLVVPYPAAEPTEKSARPAPASSSESGEPPVLRQARDTNVRKTVVLEISKVTGKSPSQIGDDYPLVGDQAPSYIERIQIIDKLERQFELKIPDEHWKSLTTVAQLTSYIQQRILLQQRYPHLKTETNDWATTQQSLPPEERPVFKH